MRPLRMLAAAGALALMAACAAPGAVTPQTPAQTLFAWKAGYSALLDLAVAYKDECFAKPDVLQGECREVVATLRDLDRDVQRAEAMAEVAIETGNGDATEAAIRELHRLKREFEEKLAEEMLKEQKA